MVPAMTKTAPPLAPEPIDTDLVASTVTEIPLPDQPRYPAQPPIPDQDTIIASMENPAPLPPKAATAGIAEADPAPEASAAAAVVPAPEVNPDAGAMPPPKTEPEVVLVQPDTAPDLAPESDPEVRTAQQPADDTPVKPPTPPVILPKPEIAALPDAQDPPGSTLPPAPGFRGSAEGVIVGRLPRIGDAPASEPPPAADPAAADPPDTRPRVVHAAAFDNPGAKPLFAVVLIDDGASTLDRVALASLPFPVSFALDPLDPATPDRAAIYRAAGKEVVMLATGIVEGAQASDVEVAFEAMDRGLPEAVAVMDLPEMRFQDNRPLASLVVPVVAAQGRGLLTWDQGLNAADQVARREDLAAAVIFRPIDGAGEDRTAIRRGLDRAAFKSAQDGRVTVVGRTTDETVAALLEWTVEGRAATVALAPLSAVLAID